MAQAPTTTTLTQNILREGLILSRTPDPAVMVIFGASGDLTSRKLMPALYNLALNRYLPSGFSVIGVADTALSEEEFRSLCVVSPGLSRSTARSGRASLRV